MDIGIAAVAHLAQWAAPTITALAVLVQNLGNRRSITRRLDEMERRQQLLILHDTHLPLSTRLDAGKLYLDLGGNGSSSAYYEKLKHLYQQRVEKDMEAKPSSGTGRFFSRS